MPAYPRWRKVWGDANALMQRARIVSWVDVVIVLSVGGLLYGLLELGRQWTGANFGPVEIDPSPTALPRYTFFSLARGLVAYCISLLFTLSYGYWAAKDRRAERILLPLLDILQSIPVVGFLPGVLLVLTAAFPNSNIGPELAAVVLIFTGQAWNMTFSFYNSLRSVPMDQREVATVYRFTSWQRFKWVELPFSTIGLVWNSMMSMAGGWFFLMLSEQFDLGPGKDFRLPGLGSYMQVVVQQGDIIAQLWAILAMVLMILALDQLLWRPVVVWSQKFRVEEGGAQETETSWFLNWLRRSQLIRGLQRMVHKDKQEAVPKPPPARKPEAPRVPRAWESLLAVAALLALLAALGLGLWMLGGLLWSVPVTKWGELGLAAAVTLGRVLLCVMLGTLWAVPAGLAIGLSPRLSRVLQPAVQVVASFPAPMLFPLVLLLMHFVGGSLGWFSILLMLLGTQWYVLFNVVAGAMAIPADLREVARSYRLGRLRRFWVVYLPSIFPYLVTAWVTAAGGAWNVSIISEYDTFGESHESTFGLGAMISDTFKQHQYSVLAAAVTVMALVVVLFNRTVWRRLYRLGEERFALNK